MQRPSRFFAGVGREQFPLRRPNEFARRQDDPAIVVADSDELARCDTKRSQSADKCCSVIVIGDGFRIERALPSRKNMLQQRVETAGCSEVLKEGIGAISSPGSEVRRIVDHQPKE